MRHLFSCEPEEYRNFLGILKLTGSGERAGNDGTEGGFLLLHNEVDFSLVLSNHLSVSGKRLEQPLRPFWPFLRE